MNQNSKFKQLGQSLLEVTVTVGIAALVVSAIAITTLIGLKNSEYSQNQIQATKVAQEGIERVRAMRDNNNPICTGNPTTATYYWSTPTTLWNVGIFTSPGAIFYLVPIPATTCYLQQATVPSEQNINNKFTRVITLKNYGAGATSQLQVTSQVTWSDSSGVHTTTLDTILSAYQTQ